MKLTEKTEKKIIRIVKDNPGMEAAVFMTPKREDYIFVCKKDRLGIFKPDFVVDNFFIYVRCLNDPDIIDDYFREITSNLEHKNVWAPSHWDYAVFY